MSQHARTRSLLVVGLCGCVEAATQLTVVTSSDLPPESRACVLIEARPLEAPEFTASTPVDRPEVPFSFGVAPPGGDADRNVEVRVSAFSTCDAASDPSAQPVVSRRVRTGFIERATLRLDVVLSSKCRDVVCPEDQTCSPETGACVAVEFIDPEDLERVKKGDELAARPEAGGPDAGRDGAAPGDATAMEGACTPLATRPWYALTSPPPVPNDLAARRTDAGLEWLSASGGEQGLVLRALTAAGKDDRELARIDEPTYKLGLVALDAPGRALVVASPVGGRARVRRVVVSEAGGATDTELLQGYTQGTDDIAGRLGRTPVALVDRQGLGPGSNLYAVPPDSVAVPLVSDFAAAGAENELTLASAPDGAVLVAGVLSADATGPACRVLRLSGDAPPLTGERSAPVATPEVCSRPGVAALADGHVAVVTQGETLTVWVLSADLATVVASRALGAGTRPAVVGLPDGAMRVAWATAQGVSTLRVAGDAELTPGAVTALTAEGATDVDYAQLQHAGGGRSTALTFTGRPGGTPTMMLSVLCD